MKRPPSLFFKPSLSARFESYQKRTNTIFSIILAILILHMIGDLLVQGALVSAVF